MAEKLGFLSAMKLDWETKQATKMRERVRQSFLATSSNPSLFPAKASDMIAFGYLIIPPVNDSSKSRRVSFANKMSWQNNCLWRSLWPLETVSQHVHSLPSDGPNGSRMPLSVFYKNNLKPSIRDKALFEHT